MQLIVYYSITMLCSQCYSTMALIMNLQTLGMIKGLEEIANRCVWYVCMWGVYGRWGRRAEGKPMETTSVETPGAAADMPCICVANRGALAAMQRERKGREGGAPCFCSFNSGGLYWCVSQPSSLARVNERDSSAQNTRRHSRHRLGTKVT